MRLIPGLIFPNLFGCLVFRRAGIKSTQAQCVSALQLPCHFATWPCSEHFPICLSERAVVGLLLLNGEELSRNLTRQSEKPPILIKGGPGRRPCCVLVSWYFDRPRTSSQHAASTENFQPFRSETEATSRPDLSSGWPSRFNRSSAK